MPRPRSDKPVRRPEVEPAGPPHAISPWVQLRSPVGHPFVYQRMLAAADPAAQPGAVVNVYDKHGGRMGSGLFNPRSQIAVRMLTWGDEPVDAGVWARRIGAAVELRDRLRLADESDAYRLVHAEGDGLSGLMVERYADCLVLEFHALGMFLQREAIVAALRGALPAPQSLDRPDRAAAEWQVVFRANPRAAALEGFDLPPPTTEKPPRVIIREHGIRYRVDVAEGHKTGFFCDQRENRRRLAVWCAGASVLDLCCYTGGFGLCAKLLGNARDVTGVDLDEAAIAVAKENANLNQARITYTHSDAFIYLRQMLANQRQFDVVVLDPPKLALTRRDLEEAQRKYHDLNALAVQVVRPGGVLVTCSCSGLVGPDEFLNIVHRAARGSRRQLQRFDFTGAGPDHPVMMNCPESSYLKVAWLRVAN